MPSVIGLLAAVLVLSQMKITDALKCDPDPPNNKTICRLEAVADTWLEGSYQRDGYNFVVVAKHPGYDLKRTIMKFEDFPSSQCSQVVRAHMYVSYWYAHKDSGSTIYQVPFISRPIQVRQLLRHWDEKEATSIQATSTTEWNVKYVGFDGVDADIGVNDVQTVHNERPRGFLEWDITLAAENWSHGDANHGVILSASNELAVGRDIRLYSRENEQNLRPYMTVVCQNI